MRGPGAYIGAYQREAQTDTGSKMECSLKVLLYFWLLSIPVPGLMSRNSNVDATDSTIRAITANSDECERHRDMFRILENIVTGSKLNHVTLITDVHATGCVDLTYMTSVTYITSCTTWNQDIFWQSASRELTLMNFVIDCNVTVTENIIKELLSARSLGSKEKRLLLPVYNMITTDHLELNISLGLDVTALHFVSIVKNDSVSGRMDKASLADEQSRHSSCKHLMNLASHYEIRKSESGGPWNTLATYGNNQYIGSTALLRSEFENFERMNLKVTHSLYTPFTMRKNGVYYGFCIDLLKSVANTLNFTYELIYSIDKKFGVKNSRGTWNGMIGMMDRKEVDMIVAGLTITYLREQVVDFTVPFYEETSAVVVRTNILESDIPWTYLFEPLELNLWLMVAGSVVVFSFLGYVVEELGSGIKKQQTMSPVLHDESTDRHFSLTSNFWLLVCSYARQGAEAIPLSGSGRMTMSAIWIFTLMIGWLYNANLTASLTTVYRKPPFNNLAELANDTEYTLMLNGGSVQRLLLEGAKRGIYASLWKKIEKTQAASLRSGTTDALRVMFNDTRTKYAVMGDLTSLKTKLARDYGSRCDWAYIPEMFFTSGLGIALPEGSPYKPMFDDAVFKALESGLSLRYKKKNFYPSNCHMLKMGSDTEAKPISISHIKTFLILTGGGIVLSSLVFLIESRLIKSKRGKTATSLKKMICGQY